MTEANNPVDIGKEQVKLNKKPIEDMLVKYDYRGKSRSLPELIGKVDKEEPYVMSNLGRETYLAVREGMQVFKTIGDLLSDKIGMRQRLIKVPVQQLGTDPELMKMRDFAFTFATYAASRYVSKRLENALAADGVADTKGTTDLSSIVLQTADPDTTVMKRLVAPVFASLLDHVEAKDAEDEFSSPASFTILVKQVFEHYAELALKRKDVALDLRQHIDGYTWRVMDDFVTLRGYEDRSLPAVTAVKQKLDFQPIDPKEIVGNLAAKRKIARYVERLALYNVEKQMNPVLELGGLSWSNLFDGPPGTGKSSLFRLAMTRLRDLCEMTGTPYAIFTVDQSIKDEYYGKTGKILLERIGVTKDAKTLSIGIFDDIDLLTSTRNDAQGADNDINNIIMQYMDGVFTVRRGNVINFAATNKPTGIDDALRNRFNDRILIDGPVTGEDFADIVMLKLGKMQKYGFVKMPHGYTPFATQDQEGEHGWSGGDVAAYAAERFVKFKSASVLDFGKFMAELKGKNPLITGRSANAIMESIKERAADFDIPKEWFSDRTKFFGLPFEQQIKQLSELYTPITADILFQEAQRYFDSEERFGRKEAERRVLEGYNGRVWDMQAELQFLEEQVQAGNTGVLAKVGALKSLLNKRFAAGNETVAEALRKAAETER